MYTTSLQHVRIIDEHKMPYINETSPWSRFNDSIINSYITYTDMTSLSVESNKRGERLHHQGQ